MRLGMTSTALTCKDHANERFRRRDSGDFLNVSNLPVLDSFTNRYAIYTQFDEPTGLGRGIGDKVTILWIRVSPLTSSR